MDSGNEGFPQTKKDHLDHCQLTYLDPLYDILHFPGSSDGQASAHNMGDLGSIPGSGRSPGEGNGNPLQCSCLENPMDRGVWEATVHGSQSQTWLSE